MNVEYLAKAMLSLPTLPLLYWQAIQVRSKVPTLPEAREPEGFVKGKGNQIFKLAIIGESTMAGIGVDRHEDGFAGAFAKALADQYGYQVEWKVFAQSGFTAKQITEQIIPNLPGTSFDGIVIGTGGNDAFSLNYPRKWKKRVQELIAAIREQQTQVPIVFANMPPIREFPAFPPLMQWTLGNLVEILGRELDLVVAETDDCWYYSRVISLQDWSLRLKIEAQPEDYFSDGVHPSKLTYQAWATDLGRWVKEQGIFKK